MTTKKEQIDIGKFRFNADGLIPVVTQDYESGEVLMLVYMNKEAVVKTFETGYAHYYSRSKQTVTKFGETLGNTQRVKAAFLDHDSDTLLIKVQQNGKADPERKEHTFFPEQIKGDYKDIGGEMFGRLQRIVGEYKKNREDGGYTSFLFARGVDRISKKVGEEAVELVIASKNAEKEGVINEAADLLYHVMVLLSARDVKISEVCAELCKRNR
ncbi:MAG: bifunctional phosphoribosyl-AMP cyclohydrolase/phosphoribosyl-ATP diphosphatase HisIE [Clostridia bacterium]|nr:bifunctional phosphoribosyl-AMP cyclohydrolase/phosphoribosyl-ATP diphosphatase HisIE [Clostridia bacterium]